MRITGWILTLLGYYLAYWGFVITVGALMDGRPVTGIMILGGIGKLVFAVLAFWGGKKLRDKADARAYALEKAAKDRT